MRKPFKDVYRAGTKYGETYKKIIQYSYKEIQKGKRDNDFLLLIIAEAGKGKSNLGLWTYEMIEPQPSIDQIAITQEDCANGLDNATKTPVRFFMYDEGKINRQGWQDKFYQKLLSVYHDIRGLNIFHIWCNAYPSKLPLHFIEERVKGVIYIYKDCGNHRRFYYFTKKRITKFLEQNKELNIPLLNKYGESHAFLDSYFTEYDGKLKQEYLAKKDVRMKDVIADFKAEFGNKTMTIADVVRRIGMKRDYINKYLEEMVEKEEIVEHEHYLFNVKGNILLNERGLEALQRKISLSNPNTFSNRIKKGVKEVVTAG